MAGEIPDLEAFERTGTGKGAARQARRDGMVPGIVFGGDLDPLPINLDFNKLLTKLRAGRFKATLFNLKVEGQEDVRVICRDVQRDVVKDLPTHVDFLRLRRTTNTAMRRRAIAPPPSPLPLHLTHTFVSYDVRCRGHRRAVCWCTVHPR